MGSAASAQPDMTSLLLPEQKRTRNLLRVEPDPNGNSSVVLLLYIKPDGLVKGIK
jgi:hypothetical protein